MGCGFEQNFDITEKKNIRSIICSKFYTHTEPLFKKLNILNVNDLYILRVLKFCFKLFNHKFFLCYLDTINDII